MRFGWDLESNTEHVGVEGCTDAAPAARTWELEKWVDLRLQTGYCAYERISFRDYGACVLLLI